MTGKLFGLMMSRESSDGEISDAEGGVIDEEIKHKGMDGSIEWILKKDGELVIVGACGEEQKNGWENYNM